MKKLIYVFAIVALGTAFISCEQEDISPDQYELVDPELTEEEGGEKEGDRPSSKKT
ncbi:hypothetical protein [Ekhidna sp.]|uniref:hypothetical protein n=1 Tax=Ekhidna sp. TaxID=2608089 RepID=UPI0032989ABE